MNQFDGGGAGNSPINRLIEAFHRLPGIGPKSAQRLAYHVLRASEGEAVDLADALIDGRGVQELAPKGKAAAEIRAVWKWIQRRL